MAPTWLKQTFWTLAASGLVYVLGILSLTNPTLQRNITYAHNVNPAPFQNLSDVESFGFIYHQVQQFTIASTDNVTLHGWHILPTHLYLEHYGAITSQSNFGKSDWSDASRSVGPQLLLNDPKAFAIVSFHGNAAHLVSADRPAFYQQLLATSTQSKPVHVIAFDYRGFGLSSGTPSERGVIDDGLSITSALCSHLKPSQVILIGQSMGTFISTATFHAWTLRGRAPFKALILLASFPSLPKLLDSYSILGLLPPVFSPMIGYPSVVAWIKSKIIDKWDTASLITSLLRQPNMNLDLTIVHAADDYEIPVREGYENWKTIVAAADGTGELTEGNVGVAGKSEFASTWTSDDGRKRAKWQKIPRGGHNRMTTSEHVKVAVYDVLNRDVVEGGKKGRSDEEMYFLP